MGKYFSQYFKNDMFSLSFVNHDFRLTLYVQQCLKTCKRIVVIKHGAIFAMVGTSSANVVGPRITIPVRGALRIG
jgi:hypothetical protein